MNCGMSRRRLGLVLAVTLVAAAFVLNSVQGQGFRPPIGPRPPVGIGGGVPGAGINGGMPVPPGVGINGGIAGGVPGAGIVGGVPTPPAGIVGGIGGGGILGGPREQYICDNCGKVVGQGNFQLRDAPSSCPFCGVRFINGGRGRGGPPPGNPGVTPPGNPGMQPPFNPGNGVPPVMPNPGFPPNAGQPANPGFQPANPVAQAPPVDPIKPAADVAQPSNQAPAAGTSTPTTSPPREGKSGNNMMIALVIGIIVVGLFILAGGTWLMIVALKGNGNSGRKPRRRYRDDYDD